MEWYISPSRYLGFTDISVSASIGVEKMLLYSSRIHTTYTREQNESTKSRQLSCSNPIRQGCQIFSQLMANILIKKRQKWLFFEKVMAKITKCFNYSNFYIHSVWNCSESNIFLPKKCGFAKEASFYPKTAISDINLKLPIITSLFILIKLRIKH